MGRVYSIRPSSYLSRLKRHVCETFENPPLLQVVVAAAVAGVRFRTAAGSGTAVLPATTAAAADDQNFAANFRPLVLKPSRRCDSTAVTPPW